MVERRLFRSMLALALMLLLTGAVIGQHRVSAQDDTPHPAHIHAGTCDQLGDVVFPLVDVSPAALVDGTSMAGERVGAADAIPVQISGTTVPASLADILAAPHAINIHESAENIGNYIACGNIGGTMIATASLAIGLGELNDSGYSGIATLVDNGNGSTSVSVYLMSSGMAMGDMDDMSDDSMAAGTPASDDMSDDSAMDDSMGGAEVAASIAGFAYEPAMVMAASGDTVTWTNNDSVPHTVTSSTGLFQSGTMQPGDTFSFTFTDPGTYDYFCEFHAGMTGQVMVS